MSALRKKLFIGASLLVALTVVVYAQDPQPTTSKVEAEAATDAEKDKKKEEVKSPKPVKEKPAPAIEDNSFFIEEAFNQGRGIVQHVSTCVGFRRPQSDIVCSFTQEWPVPNEKHQLSYTLPYSSFNSNQYYGVGDVMLNYRYELKGADDWALITPRVSLILPTGSTHKGLGTGSAGFQFNLPVSKKLSEKFITHYNAGFTVLPKVKGEDLNGNQFRRGLSMYNLGGSVIWLAKPKFNLMLEYLTNFNSEFDPAGNKVRFKEQILNPGFRFAIDVGDLQVVPGVAVPTSFSQGERRHGLFFYVSFEHPFSKREKK